MLSPLLKDPIDGLSSSAAKYLVSLIEAGKERLQLL